MRKPTYTIYDNVSQIFNWPFAAYNDADAIRSFTQNIEREMMERKNEFSLYTNGFYDDNTGTWEPSEPTCIFRGSEIGKEETLKVVNDG